jgi:hypothetical protein
LLEQGLVVATFSTFGFIIFFALPPIMSTSWELTLKTSDIERLTKFHVRFSSLFTDVKVFCSFITLSISFLIAGLLALLYYGLSAEILVTIAVWLEIGTIFGAIIAMLSLFIGTYRYSRKDLQTVIAYAQSRPPKRNKVTTKKTNGNNQKPQNK